MEHQEGIKIDNDGKHVIVSVAAQEAITYIKLTAHEAQTLGITLLGNAGKIGGRQDGRKD